MKKGGGSSGSAGLCGRGHAPGHPPLRGGPRPNGQARLGELAVPNSEAGYYAELLD